MGNPRKFRKKYSGPAHPWQALRIQEENVLVHQYGLKNKTELWRASSKLKSFGNQAKSLIVARGKQADLERDQLLKRLVRLGLLNVSNASLDSVLGLTVRNVLDRRLQTMLVKKGFAATLNQARQFIVHEHVLVGKRKIKSPSYFVPVDEEGSIAFVESSVLKNADHPARVKK